MKSIGMEQTTLDACVEEAQHERVLITHNGVPVALVVGLGTLDQEQIELGCNDEFWHLLTERRKQKTISRAELEERLDSRESALRRS